MTPDQIRKSYSEFMTKRGAFEIPSASLVPENDPSTLFTGSGMQPMVPYLLGETHPAGRDLINIQKCCRTGDIEEVGDNSHLTFFEMIGRWDLKADPENFKKNQLEWIFDWQVDVLGLNPQHLYVTVFKGDPSVGIDRDDEAIEIWTKIFKARNIDPKIESNGEKYGTSRGGRIFLYDADENWWSRSGRPANMPIGELGGPDSEMFFDFEPNGDIKDHPASDSGRFLEIGNNVFMSHQKVRADSFLPLEKPNIDYGGGLERICAAVNTDRDVYNTPFFKTPKLVLTDLSGKLYHENLKLFRIILDHCRAATFLVGDGVHPGNQDAEYITRRLIRRAMRAAMGLGIKDSFMGKLITAFLDDAKSYSQLQSQREIILNSILTEEKKFQKLLISGEREILKHVVRKGEVTGFDAFNFYQTYGFPKELTEEVLKEQGLEIQNINGFEKASNEHSKMSATASAGKFKGGLADASEKTTAFHTAAHLMLAGLREVLGSHVHQKGSNITADRIRFDFSHDMKMTDEEKRAVEEYVNRGVEAKALVTVSEMAKDEAYSQGVEGSFWEKYPDIVKVYSMEDPSGKIWSKELCGGPHVENCSILSNYGQFKIGKEQSSSAGTRRVKATFVE
ncbi:MAG: alanine--tRNA ligase [Rhodobacteraceae bacterium]|jgi:alanyl-tRNA synthetase|nr:alanine--tRNA ligase [Paracoccaceae bacterium]MBV04214.1 alanine--tRNA ligase [Paracoccaceae bacterium]|tara:strand:+ start:7448 stop:9310 length:1863 start_codon:yes stop_codon:yes gene_type:complete